MAQATSGTKIAGRKCPNCFTVVLPGRERCPKCKMDVANMDAMDAARKAAAAKGKVRTEIEESGGSLWRHPGVILSVIVLLGLGAFLAYRLTRTEIPAWSKYPTSREAAVQALLTHISTGEDADYDKAYALIAPSARDKEDTDEQGHYRGLFHAVYKYLTGEFGPGWEATAVLTPTPGDPDTIEAKVGLETLHIRVEQQTPADALAKGSSDHFAIIGIQEFNIAEAAGFQGNEARMGVIKGIAGQAAVNNLQQILGAGEHLRQTDMQRKVSLLPILRDPRQSTSQAIVRTWKVREDAVVRNRLEQIAGDDRYDPAQRERAKKVLNGTLEEEERIAVGVD